jgi:hypothetical protein
MSKTNLFRTIGAGDSILINGNGTTNIEVRRHRGRYRHYFEASRNVLITHTTKKQKSAERRKNRFDRKRGKR